MDNIDFWPTQIRNIIKNTKSVYMADQIISFIVLSISSFVRVTRRKINDQTLCFSSQFDFLMFDAKKRLPGQLTVINK